jgi:hypothetical protein
MKTIGLLVLLLQMAAGFPVFAAPKKVLERAWLGGEFKLAKSSRTVLSKDVVGAFPELLRRAQRSGVLVCSLATNAPAALAGIRAGDLILEADGRLMTSLRRMGQFIGDQKPGDKVRLSIYREGELLELPVKLGRETYQRERSLTVGLLLSSECDVFPNPEFSLIALGFKRRSARLELNSPETQFLLSTRVANGSASSGVSSREGWQAWLAIISLGSHKRILSQELIDIQHVATASRR